MPNGRKVIAVIVTHRPQIRATLALLHALTSQVDDVSTWSGRKKNPGSTECRFAMSMAPSTTTHSPGWNSRGSPQLTPRKRALAPPTMIGVKRLAPSEGEESAARPARRVVARPSPHSTRAIRGRGAAPRGSFQGEIDRTLLLRADRQPRHPVVRLPTE
jgi:hypothetical protein